jgi:hypothetical protein
MKQSVLCVCSFFCHLHHKACSKIKPRESILQYEDMCG